MLTNNLNKSTSSYLKGAGSQPVFWQEWDKNVFDLAEELDRPILLDIGAVWCHWCHVMDRESYENADIARIINDNFIPVKVDRDERPDVDSRYQNFVTALGRGGGWPLTCFLMPDGKLFFGGTYFPPEDRVGFTGLKTLLMNISTMYKNKRSLIEEQSRTLYDYILAPDPSPKGNNQPDDSIINEIANEIEASFDPENGGFGSAPKFPQKSALELIMLLYKHNGNKKLLDIARQTLNNMADGGIYDQLGGGFHRYSVDEEWFVPHFEKITSVNAEILSNYIHIFRLTGEERYKNTALGIINYLDTEMADRENGGFYSSQDADVSLDDDGSYFTWESDELEQVLTENEYKAFVLRYGISDNPGYINENPLQNVLRIRKDIKDISEHLNIQPDEVSGLLESAESKLSNVRNKREKPYIDKTIYADVNGMMISEYSSAYFSEYSSAYSALRKDSYKGFALKTLDRIIEKMYSPQKGFAHSLSSGKPKHYGLLEDQVRMAHALIDGFKLSGNIKYFEISEKLTGFILEHFEDRDSGGFFDRNPEYEAGGILNMPRKHINDFSQSSANSEMVRVLQRLFGLTGNIIYREASERTLKEMSASNVYSGTSSASFASALFLFLNPPPTVFVFGDHKETKAKDLFKAADRIYKHGKEIFFINDASETEELPPSLRGKFMVSRTNLPAAFVCTGQACSPPLGKPEEIAEILGD